jgi:DNA polymerase Ligase (LigD)
MPRFVILTHDFPEPHWDFMLENEARLRTWRLGQPGDATGKVPALALADHRLAYLDYEGPVSGNRGSVSRWDRGDYELLYETERSLGLRLRGSRLCGKVLLEMQEAAEAWVYSYVPDTFAIQQ